MVEHYDKGTGDIHCYFTDEDLKKIKQRVPTLLDVIGFTEKSGIPFVVILNLGATDVTNYQKFAAELDKAKVVRSSGLEARIR